MENKDRLDELLRRKFAEDDPEHRFAFREEYWLQAQTLIEAAERRKRRRGFFWWWMVGGLGAGVLVAWWLLAGPARNTANQTALLPETPDTVVLENAAPEQLVKQRTLSKPQQEVTNNKSEISRLEAASLQKTPPWTGETPPRPGETPPRPSPEGERDAVSYTTPSPSGEGRGGVSPDRGGVSPGRGGVSPREGQDGVSQPSPGGIALVEPGDKSSVPASFLISPADLLPLPLQFLQRPLPRLNRPTRPAPPVAGDVPTRHRDWRWEAGVVAAASSPTGHLRNESVGIGGGLIARLQRKGSPFAWNAGLNWRWRQGSFSDSLFLQDEENRRYSFGYTLDRVQQRITGTHWLELPLYAQYRWPVISAELGVMPALLLYVQGREDHIRRSSLAPEPQRTDSQKIRIDNRYFTNLSASVFAGVEWQPTNRLCFGLRMHYQPGQLLNNPEFEAPRNNPVWADLRVRFFYLTPKKEK